MRRKPCNHDDSSWCTDECMKEAESLDTWEWPYLRYSDGPEYACPHGVGHGKGVHGCDGCCSHPSFSRETNK